MSSKQRLARELLDTRRLALGHATTPQLSSSSIDGGGLGFRDPDGNDLGSIGVGDDGGLIIDYLGGPKPPKPSQPTVSADAGIFRIEWDGSFENAGDSGVLATSDTDRVEIHASMDENFVPDRVESFGGAFATLDGGSFALGPLPEAGTYYFRLVARSKSSQFSEPSERVEQELAITSIDLAVTDAWLTGDAAQNTADGKNGIWRGPDEPVEDPDVPFKDGDIWFEMVDGKSIPNIWDDSTGKWVGNDDYRQSEIERVQEELRGDLDAVITDGSGTKNFFRPTEPPASESSEGDLWFDSSADGKNLPNVFEDGAWHSIADQRVDDIAAAQEDMAGDITAAEASAIAEAKSLADAAKAAANSHTDTKVFGSTQIADDAITTPKIKAGAVGAVAIAADSIEAKHITARKLLADAVLVGGSVGATLIENGAITTDKILAGAITAESGIIGSINAGTITVGEMSGARIKANTVAADRVLIGTGGNLAPWDQVRRGETVEPHETFNGDPDGTISIGAEDTSRGVPAHMVHTRTSSQSGAYGPVLMAGLGQRMLGEPGKSYTVTFKVYSDDMTCAISPRVYWYTSSGNYAGRADAPTEMHFNLSPTPQQVSFTAVMPDAARQVAPMVATSGDIAERVGDIHIVDWQLKETIGATLIEGGAITTEHIRTGAITAESGIIGSIDANVITVGKIMGNQLDADAINGKTITGATIRTASSGSRVELTHNGLKQYNSLGATIVDMSAGSLNMLGVLRQENAVAQMEVGTSPASENSELAPGLFWSGGAFSGSPRPPAITAGLRTAPVMAEQGTGYALTMQGPNQFSMGELGDGWWRFTAHDGSPSEAWGTTYQSTSGLTSYTKSSLGTAGIKTEVERSGNSGRVTIETTATADDERSFMQLMTDSIRIQSNVAGVNNNIFLNKYQIALNADQGSVRLGSTGAKVTSKVNSVFLQAPTGTQYGHRLVNHLTTTGTANVIMATDGTVRRVTSSRRTKLNEAVLDEEIPSFDDKLLSLTPKMWHDKAAVEAMTESLDVAAEGKEFDGLVPDMPLARIPGVVAEDVEGAGLEPFVTYSPEGEVESVMYDRLGIALIPVVGRLRDRIEQLERKLAD